MKDKIKKNKSRAAVGLGRKGGNALKKKYGNGHFKKLVGKRWNKENENKES